ncbi:MAG TPA: sugar transferase [Candidatus Krumholzibacteria bacterium]|nr:sugar transferase [Candidatus Krumholzibacteria bacterium]
MAETSKTGFYPAGEPKRTPGHERPRVTDLHSRWSEAPASKPQGRVYGVARRALDIGASVTALSVFGAMLPFLALAIKMDSPGPVFYAQTRVGMNRRRRDRGAGDSTCRRKIIQPGRPFTVYKLRSMRSDAERHGPQLAGANDTRITKVGHFLRKSRLDEVPQFWNVLRGEMSLIGPRPERLHFIHQYDAVIPGYTRRLVILPGITGLAQVRNGYDEDLASVKRKVAMDRCYMRRQGFLTDLRILLETVRVVITGHGAR